MDAGAFNSWHNANVIDPVGVVATLLAVFGVFAGSRTRAMIVFAALICFMAPGQRITLAGLDFTPLRVVIISAWIRVLLRGEQQAFRWMAQDYLVIGAAIVPTIAYAILRGGGMDVIANRAGQLLDTAAVYFLFRMLVRDARDVRNWFATLAVLAIPVACVIAVEWSTGRNLFAFLGGVPDITLVREGRLRCQGAFPHPILAGIFWASVLPVFAACAWIEPANRLRWVIALAAGLAIVVFSASSTPVSAVMIGAIALVMYPCRAWLPALRWVLLGVVVLLHVLMEKGVLHVFARLDIVGGSTGWHRYYLSQSAIDNLGDWWLLGTLSTGRWGNNLGDVTNQYILEGVRGGLAATLLLVASIVIAFRSCGRFIRRARYNKPASIFAYSVGAAVLVHAVTFWGVSYFGQLVHFWAITLALTSVLDQCDPSSLASAARSRSVTESASRAAVSRTGGRNAESLAVRREALSTER